MLTFLDKCLKNLLQVVESDWGQEHRLSDRLKGNIVKFSNDKITVVNVFI